MRVIADHSPAAHSLRTDRSRAVKPLNALMSSLETTVFTVMSALAARHDAVNLGQGFPDTEGPDFIVRAASEALLDGRNQYAPMPGVPELRQAVASSEARHYGIIVDPDSEVLVTAGASEALAASLMALLDQGDEIILFEPLFDTYLPIIRMIGAVPRIVRLEAPDWSLPEQALREAFGPKTKAILLNTPMNPCGKVFGPDELALVAELVQAHDAYAICDEVYEHLVYAPSRHIPLRTLPGMSDRCLRIGSAGKTFSLTGWRVGYVTGPKSLVSVVMRVHQNLVFAIAPNLQRAVAVGLNAPDSYFAELSDSLRQKRDRLHDGLTEIGFDVMPIQGSYFLIADYRRLGFEADDMAFCRLLVEKAGVAAIPVAAFYDRDAPQGFVRFAFCKRNEVLDEGIARMRAFFSR
ncbi:Aspartate aminotransferase [Granulibacter bethesdensis CGDNIH4]|nr:Aspartate aminotransferase [Granulibacter bethesdensis CGDNIH4]